MKLQHLAEAPKAPTANDKLGILMELHKAIKKIKPVKIPKLDRALVNAAIEEAVERFNATGTGDAHDVVFPYDSDFGIAVKATSILGGHKTKGKNLAAGAKAEIFKQYLEAVQTLVDIAPTAEVYGKFVYSLIIHLWILLKEIYRTDAHKQLNDDEAFAAKVGLQGLGVKLVKPR